MQKAIVCINFYEHADAAVAGTPAGTAPMGAFFRSLGREGRRATTLSAVSASRIGTPKHENKTVSVLDYNAALNESANKALSNKILTGCIAACREDVEQVFLVTGFSSGGITAIYMARQLATMKLNLLYINRESGPSKVDRRQLHVKRRGGRTLYRSCWRSPKRSSNRLYAYSARRSEISGEVCTQITSNPLHQVALKI